MPSVPDRGGRADMKSLTREVPRAGPDRPPDLEFPGVPHNRLLVTLARAMGHESLARFGNPDYCGDGLLEGLA